MLMWDDEVEVRHQERGGFATVAIIPFWVAILAEFGAVALGLCLGIWLGSF